MLSPLEGKRTSIPYGGNTGSNPVADANEINNFREVTVFLYDPLAPGVTVPGNDRKTEAEADFEKPTR
ncbi:MAG TPA: hypothetical protein VF447_16665 [Terriglobales bacterium]